MPWVDVAEIVRLNPPTQKEIEQVHEYRKQKVKARFLADENFPQRVTRGIRRWGARVVTVQELRTRGHPDENHAAYALKHGLMLLSCDRDYLDERKFPLIHCPAIAVFDFASGSAKEILGALQCLSRVLSAPQFFDKWVKIDANPTSWTEYSRHLDGTTARSRYRLVRGRIQEWVVAASSGA